MASRFSVEATFKAIDKMTAPIKKMLASSQSMSSQLNKDFRRAGRSSESFFSKIGGFGPIATVLSGAGIIEFANKSIEAFKGSEEAIANTQASITSTAGIAGRSLEQLKNQSNDLMKQSFFDDDDILQNVSAQMLTFTNITGNQFDRAQATVLDVTAKLNGLNATGEDLKGTTLQLSKALNTGNIAPLSRSGIQFTEVQKKMVKSLFEAGKVAEAQNIILGEIEKQYGGTAKALAGTDSGKIIQKQVEIANSMEDVGKTMLPVKAKILSGIAEIMPALVSFFNITVKISTVFVKFLKALSPVMPLILSISGVVLLYNNTLAIASKLTMAFFEFRGMSAGQIKIKLLLVAVGLIIFGIYTLYKNWDKLSESTKRWIKVAGFFIGIITSIIAFVKLWTIAQTALNIVTALNPAVGIAILIIAGITAIIAAIWFLYNNWSTVWAGIKNIGLSVWDSLKIVAGLFFEGIKTYLFTFADLFLSTWGNIIKTVLTGASVLGSVLGFDTSGIDNLINKIETAQKTVREGSIFGIENKNQKTTSDVGVQAVGQTIQKSIAENNNNMMVTIGNKSENQVYGNGKKIKTGSTMALTPTG